MFHGFAVSHKISCVRHRPLSAAARVSSRTVARVARISLENSLPTPYSILEFGPAAARTVDRRSRPRPASGATHRSPHGRGRGSTGDGYVAAHRGAYSNAISRGRGSTVHTPLVTCASSKDETSRAVNTTTEHLIRLLGKSARATGARRQHTLRDRPPLALHTLRSLSRTTSAKCKSPQLCRPLTPTLSPTALHTSASP